VLQSQVSGQPNPSQSVELWGGVECTVNRVGDAWFDQTVQSGHEERLPDLALFAELGIRKLRYPALWERMVRERGQETDFRWTDERLPEMKRLHLDPILTLCHHGSGPYYTSLLDDSFATGLAAHAFAVAERYPWIEDYTPVNEPLTTARFSALYGFWYPHTRDEDAFWTALLNEVDATRLSMREIRRFNPAARLVQTDDLGFCHATPALRCEADFQNERRWMGWDLLCGMVVPGHSLWERLVSRGFEHRLRVIADDPCPPDIIGINHYLSSERLLDHRIHLHADRAVADQSLGKVNDVVHVDVDAIRQLPHEVIGIEGLVEQAWERYGIPIAITECHLGSTRDEQARWFIETWDKAHELRGRGVELRAVTAWSLLGSFDWNRMVTRFIGHYEPGVFDLRGGQPRPTLMAHVLKELAAGRRPEAPGLDVSGWWHADRRAGGRTFKMKSGPRPIGAPQPILILGDEGTLSRLAVDACEIRGLHYVLLLQASERAVRTANPWAVLDTRRVASKGAAGMLANVCQALAITGAVFAWPDSADVEPVPGLLVAVTGPTFTIDDGDGLPHRLLLRMESGHPLELERHVLCTAIYGPSLVDAVLDLLLDGVTGLVPLYPAESWSEADFAQALAKVAGYNENLLLLAGDTASPLPKTAPTYLPPSETMLERFVRERCARARAKGNIEVVKNDGHKAMAAEGAK
jgi:dTDP-4-dehydrorhamnose reductase